jgi:hydroxymethylglutaryl-CoA reductase
LKLNLSQEEINRYYTKLMANNEIIRGFSKMSRNEKVEWLSKHISDEDLKGVLNSYLMGDQEQQDRFEKFSENTLSNFHIPWGIVPNVMIDGTTYHVPLAIEESSVVAAASKAATFWAERGGFHTMHINTVKKGQIHFFYRDDPQLLVRSWDKIVGGLFNDISSLTQNMEQRGGGVLAINLKDMPEIDKGYFQLELEADTVDSMGANFINTILEEIGQILPKLIKRYTGSADSEIIMAILSNYTPECVVGIRVEAPIASLNWDKNMSPEDFARRMKWASDIAWHDIGRAVTHNKGIYNGIDAVVLATGNDFRAVEAAGHAYASRNGKYRSLSQVYLLNENFAMELTIPLALGTVGGLTKLHPLAAKTLQILGNPGAKTLMKIVASIGLANNFAAMASLVTTGIQKGHMKMHLHNILTSLNVPQQEYSRVETYFADKTISVAAVREYLDKQALL